MITVMTTIMTTITTMIITTDFVDAPGDGLMQENGQQPSPDHVRLHQALDCVEAVLSLERQRLQLLIDRHRGARSSAKTTCRVGSGVDAVVRIRRAA